MSLKQNVAANFVSQGWVVLMSFAFIPVYIKYLGIEAYGLIGFFTAIQAWMALIDLGLSLTLNREVARYDAGQGNATEIRGLLGSVQLVYAAAGALLLAAVWASAPFLAEGWFQSSTLAHAVLQDSLRLFGFAIVVRWASQIYRSAIQGLQRQIWLSGFTVAAITVRSVGAVLLLMFGHADVVTFFGWQLAVSLVEWLVLVLRVYGYLPPAGARFRVSLTPLRTVWRFAGGVLLTNLFAMVMTQSDKLVLSRMLSLEEFGYYTLAYTVGTAIAVFNAPVFQAVSPRLTADMASGNTGRGAVTYHKASQTMALLVLPAAAVAIFHAQDLIYLWSADALLAQRCAALAAVFVGAYTLNSLIHVPAALALSAGWSGWGMITNAAAALLILPSLIVATRYFGALGAALANLGLNLLYFLVAVRYLHRRLLVSEWRSWLVRDNLVPMLVALGLASLSLAFTPEAAGRIAAALFLAVVWFVVSIAVALSVPYPRGLVFAAAARARRAITLRLSREP